MIERNQNRAVFIAQCLFFVLVSNPCTIQGANILFFFGVSSYSHRIGVWPLTESLASRGHSVTFLSGFPIKKPSPNVTDYVPLRLKEWVDTWDLSDYYHALRVSGEMPLEYYKLFNYGAKLCEVLMDDTVFLAWIRSNRFDLWVVDALVNECAYGLAYYQGAKVIVYNTATPYPWYLDPFGIPDESSWLPDCVWHYPPKTINFAQRAMALFNPLYFNYYREVTYFPFLEGKLRSNLVPDMPPLSDLERNVSLLFVNHGPVEDYARPFPPNVIPVPGLHLTKLGKEGDLPPELKSFLGDSPFIYVSFGSMAEITHFLPQVFNVFRNTFNNRLKQLGFKVVWKMAAKRPEGLLDHIYTAEWMPQQTILVHKNIRAFVTHGGLLGIQEAISNAVPLVAFPIFAEQDYNANKLELRKVGIQLEITSVTEAEFEDAIKRVLQDESYARNMKRLSAKLLDRPASALDTAVWWTEYVLRHDDTFHLRPHSAFQTWWKKRQLDIWASIFLLLLIMLWCVVYFLVRVIAKLIFYLRTGPNERTKLKST